MKKGLLAVVFIFFQIFSISAITFERPEQFVEVDISCLGSRGTERNTTLYSIEYGVNGKKYNGLLGVQFCEDVFDTSFSADFYPSISTWKFYTRTLSIGFGVMYHFQDFFDVACEHDAFAMINYKLKTKKNFIFTFQNGLGIKAAKVYALSNNSYAWNKNAVISIKFEKLFENGIELSLTGSSYSFYRYALFISPRYCFGAAYNFDGGLRFGGEFTLGFSDQYTTAPYVNTLQFRLTARYTF